MARAFNLGAVEGDTVTALTAAGTTQGTATTITASHAIFTTVTSSAYGGILKLLDAGEESWVANADTVEPLYIYPPSGCQFNGRTANLHAVIPAGKSACFKFINSTQIIAVISA